jgi:hypothetical protein
MKRRDFIKDSAVSALAVGTVPHTFEPETFGSERSAISLPQAESKGSFWPDGARMVISISMQMEAGAQPSSGAESPMPTINPKYPDLPAIKKGFRDCWTCSTAERSKSLPTWLAQRSISTRL